MDSPAQMLDIVLACAKTAKSRDVLAWWGLGRRQLASGDCCNPAAMRQNIKGLFFCLQLGAWNLYWEAREKTEQNL